MSSLRKADNSESEFRTGISRPFNFSLHTTVNSQLIWKIDDLKSKIPLEEKVGKGSYATVWKGSFSSYPLAIKRVRYDPQVAQEVKKEVEILEKCEHPAIVSYYGSILTTVERSEDEFHLPDEGDEELWILMDFCAAGSVRDYMIMQGNPLNEEQIAAVMYDALCGLHYLHSRNIIHRDLKAANILISENGFAKLADFGISTQLNQNTITSKAQTVIGSPYWMAPEVFEGSHYGFKIDIWSLGVTAIELAQKDPPHKGLNQFQLWKEITMSPPPTLTDPDKFSPELVDFISSCLQKNPEDRPTPEELLQHPFLKNVSREPIFDIVEKILGPDSVKRKPASVILSRKVLNGKEITIEGEWEGKTAGGSFHHRTFRYNPQYLLLVESEENPIKVQLQLQQTQQHSIGFYLIKTDLDSRILSFLPVDLVARSNFTKSKSVSLELTLNGKYMIIPATASPNEEGRFKLHIKASCSVELQSIEASFAQITSEWNEFTAGGCVNYPSWRKNPQFSVTVKDEVTVQIMLESHKGLNQHRIGFFIFQSDETRVKTLAIKKDDLIDECKYAQRQAVFRQVTLKPFNRYIIIPSTFHPDVHSSFTLSVSGKSAQLSLIESSYQQINIEGEWNESNAGGSQNHPAWVNNPQFSLVQKGNGKVVIVLSQFVVKNQKPHGIGFYLFKNENEGKKLDLTSSTLKMVGKSKFIEGYETCFSRFMKEGIYTIVPASFHPDVHIRFQITVFFSSESSISLVHSSDSPVQKMEEESNQT